jgi:ferredoxin
MNDRGFFIGAIEKAFPIRFFLARLTRVPLIGHLLHYLFFQGDDIMYIPRDTVVTIGASIERPPDMVLPSTVVEHFIEKATHHWIMNFCICRESLQCTEYPIELGCLFLGEAALQIRPDLGRKVTKEEALDHVKRCREAGLVHLIGRNKLDAMWLQVSPGKKLMTICNCCPCCCLWKMLPDLDADIGKKVTRMPGVSISLSDECTGCGVCVDTCFVQAITVVERKAVISEDCRGCGRCVEICPYNALSLHVDETFLTESIERLDAVVDIS